MANPSFCLLENTWDLLENTMKSFCKPHFSFIIGNVHFQAIIYMPTVIYWNRIFKNLESLSIYSQKWKLWRVAINKHYLLTTVEWASQNPRASSRILFWACIDCGWCHHIETQHELITVSKDFWAARVREKNEKWKKEPARKFNKGYFCTLKILHFKLNFI